MSLDTKSAVQKRQHAQLKPTGKPVTVTQRERTAFAKLDLAPASFWNSFETARLALARVADATRGPIAAPTSAGAKQLVTELNKRSKDFEPLKRAVRFLASPSGQRLSDANFEAVAHAFTSRERRPMSPLAKAPVDGMRTEARIELAPGESWMVLPNNLEVIRLPAAEQDWPGEIRYRHPTAQEQAILNAQWREQQDFERRLERGEVSYPEKMVRLYGSV